MKKRKTRFKIDAIEVHCSYRRVAVNEYVETPGKTVALYRKRRLWFGWEHISSFHSRAAAIEHMRTIEMLPEFF